MASRIRPSLLINSVYIRSAPFFLHTALNGGSLTSSIGAKSSGKSGNSIVSIFINGNDIVLLSYIALRNRETKVQFINKAVMQSYLKTRPLWIQLLLFLGMAMGIFMIFSLIGMSILSSMTGISMFDVGNMSKWTNTNPQMLTFVRGMLLIQ